MNDASAISFETDSATATIALGRGLARLLRPGDVVGLSGSLGAGKTQLVRGIAAGLGSDEKAVSSPTFVLMCEYPTRPPVVHIDAYRMHGLSDLESIGWGPELTDGAVVVIEWADRMTEHLPADHLWVWLEHLEGDRRRLTFELRGTWAQRVDAVRQVVTGSVAGPDDVKQTPCPTCRKAVAMTEPSYPFCSMRCKMADLNKWFSGSYRISSPLQSDTDLDELNDTP